MIELRATALKFTCYSVYFVVSLYGFHVSGRSRLGLEHPSDPLVKY
jgi:hypothetical protein